jgi:hypothetical protein
MPGMSLSLRESVRLGTERRIMPGDREEGSRLSDDAKRMKRMENSS